MWDGGRKVTQFGNERLVLGVHHYNEEKRAEGENALNEFCEVLKLSGAYAIPVEDVDAARWRKVLW